MIDSWLSILSVLILALPMFMMAYFGVLLLSGIDTNESHIGRIVLSVICIDLAISSFITMWMLVFLIPQYEYDLGNWVSIPSIHYHFSIKLKLDALSVSFVTLSLILCGTVARFALRYLHREPGFLRFFFLYAMFLFGILLTSLSGTIETLFSGWEMVGLSSAFLVAFFHERKMPAESGLRIWAVYRVSDAAFLIAAILLHHMRGEGDFASLAGVGAWPGGHSAITGWQAFSVGLLLFVAAAGKSALFPFSGWLPRAMEGPTPSSAIFYGALSVHLGAFLLLRFGPLIQQSPLLCAIIVSVGITTSVVAALSESVQPDIKSALSFAALVQVGIIVAEIGMGLRILPLVHLIGHAFLRTLQFLRAPTLLHDYHLLENAIGGHLPRRSGLWSQLIGSDIRGRFYHYAIERGHLDAFLDRFIIRSFLSCFTFCDVLERRSMALLSGSKNHDLPQMEPVAELFEEAA